MSQRFWAAVGSAVGAGVGAFTLGYLRQEKYVVGITQDGAEFSGAITGAIIGAFIGAGSSEPKQVKTGVSGLYENPRFP